MAATHWTGPLQAGSILNTSGTTVGTDVTNVGYVSMAQSTAITQATNGTVAGLYTTGIVIPAGSQILRITLYVTTAWTGAAGTFNIGTNATATQLAVVATTTNTGAAIGVVNVLPGTDATRTGNWKNVGSTDVRIYMLSANTGSGVGVLTVEYVQAVGLT